MSSSPRPSKRPRRSTILSSEDENNVGDNAFLPLRGLRSSNAKTPTLNGKNGGASKAVKTKKSGEAVNKAVKRNSSAKSSPLSSPEKSRKSKALNIEVSENKSLHSFFSKVSNEERWRQRSATPDVENHPCSVDDIVDDDSMDEGSVRSDSKTESKNFQVLTSLQTKPSTLKPQSTQVTTSSQRFRVPALSKAPSPAPQDVLTSSEEVRPWAELFSPSNLDEVAVHKKKVQDVQVWLVGALTGKIRQRVLVLKGPAGSGKSTTTELLCNAHKCEMVRWRNPDTSESGALSSSLQFSEFIARGGDYGALSMDKDTDAISLPSSNNRMLLVEDFPSSLSWNSVAMESFRAALLQAAASNNTINVFGRKAEPNSQPPIVLVISETLVNSSTSFSDSFTAQRLLGPELLNHPGVAVIEFNPVAPTFLSKAIDLVIKKEARNSGRRRIPGSALLQKLAEIGDIRNAINSLQLLCTRGDDTGDWSGTVASRTSSKRGTKSSQPLSKTEERSMKLINARETTLDMFHAAAKVCYNKRDEPQTEDKPVHPPPKPPEHLMHMYRSRLPLVDVDDLLSETGTDVQTFISTVHQNYVLSCNHEDFADYLDGCASLLSDSELLDPDNRTVGRSRARAGARRNTIQLGAADALRQDEISFNVATRGVLFSLPNPVSRASLPDARKMDAFKMFYPASLRVWKPTEETNDLIDMAIARLSGRQKHGSQTTEAGGVSSWRSRQKGFLGTSASADKSADQDTSTNDPPRLDLDKNSLILDTLPYLTVIKSSRDEDTSILKKITQMRGFDVTTTNDDAEEDDTSTPLSATARLTQRVEAVHASINSRHGKVPSVGGVTGLVERKMTGEEPAVEKLWIEDDDIEDVDD